MRCPNCGYIIDSKELTEREAEVEKLLLTGLTCKEIGERLFIGAKTVDTHKRAVYRKRGVHSQLQLLAKALSCASV